MEWHEVYSLVGKCPSHAGFRGVGRGGTVIFRKLAFLAAVLPLLRFFVAKAKEQLESGHALPDNSTLVEIENHAVEIARAAGAILARHFANVAALNVEFKDEKELDPVTNADNEVQDYLKEAITRRFPKHGILGEEDKEDESVAPDFVWVLDPLDGTKNFLSGLPLYASSIGVIYRGVPIVGAVFLPWPKDSGGIVLHARKGGGAFADAEPMFVSKDTEPKGNRLVTLPGGFGGMFKIGKPLHGKVGEVRMTGSIAYELSMVAKGVTQYTITTAPLLWDAAGGAMLVLEAGGQVLVGERRKGIYGLTNAMRWTPLKSFFPSWRSGRTTMSEIRKWRKPMFLGNAEVLTYVTSNINSRYSLRRKAIRWVKRAVRPAKKKADEPAEEAEPSRPAPERHESVGR